MRTFSQIVRHRTVLRLIIPVLLVCGTTSAVIAAAGNKSFSRSSIDIGVVVGDVDKAINFYTKAIGFREIEGFSMSGQLAEDIGLTSGTPLSVRVLVLDGEKCATKLKLIELPQANNDVEDETEPVVDSRRGFQYITIFVSDIDSALERLNQAGVKPASDGPVQLGRESPTEVFILLVDDPDGNLVELVGPRTGDN